MKEVYISPLFPNIVSWNSTLDDVTLFKWESISGTHIEVTIGSCKWKTSHCFIPTGLSLRPQLWYINLDCSDISNWSHLTIVASTTNLSFLKSMARQTPVFACFRIGLPFSNLQMTIRKNDHTKSKVLTHALKENHNPSEQLSYHWHLEVQNETHACLM